MAGADKSEFVEKNLDHVIAEWAPDVNERFQSAGYFDDDYLKMMRTALISIARVRQAKDAAARSHEYFETDIA